MAHAVVGSVGRSDLLEEWEEGRCVASGEDVVRDERDVKFASADGEWCVMVGVKCGYEVD